MNANIGLLILIGVVVILSFLIGFGCGVMGLAWYIGTGKMDKELGL